MRPRHRYRASMAVTSAGKVVSIPNEGFAGGNMVSSFGDIASPTADALLNNGFSVSFTGTQAFLCDLAASEFRFLQNAASFTCFLVCCVIGASSSLQVTNYGSPAGPGFRHSVGVGAGGAVGAFNGVIRLNTTTNTVTANATVGQQNVGQVQRLTFSSVANQLANFRNGTSVATGTPSAGWAGSADAPFSMYIGANPGVSFNLNCRFAEWIAFDRLLTSAELAEVDASLFRTYGVHA